MKQPIDFAGILQTQPWTAEIHQGWDVHRALARDLFVAGLERNGLKQKDVAKKLGISPKLLTQHLTQGPSGRGIQDPKRLEMLLDLSTNSALQRAELRKHLLLAHPNRWRAARQLNSEPRVDPRPYMPHLLGLAGVAMHAPNWTASRAAYLEIATASPLLRRIDAKRFPAELVELTLVLDLAKTTISNQTEANLEHLRRAFHAVEEADPEKFGGRENHLNAQLKLIHALETTYRGLNMPNEAFDLHFEAFQELAEAHGRDFYLKPILMGQEPFSLRSTINSLAQMRKNAQRFQSHSQRSIEFYARAVDLLDTNNDQGKLWQALLKDSLARVHVKIGSKKSLERAERWLEQAQADISCARLAGALHRTVILRSRARCLRAQGSPEWREVLEDAIRINTEAGLTHQLEEIELEFGLNDRGYS